MDEEYLVVLDGNRINFADGWIVQNVAKDLSHIFFGEYGRCIGDTERGYFDDVVFPNDAGDVVPGLEFEFVSFVDPRFVPFAFSFFGNVESRTLCQVYLHVENAITDTNDSNAIGRFEGNFHDVWVESSASVVSKTLGRHECVARQEVSNNRGPIFNVNVRHDMGCGGVFQSIHACFCALDFIWIEKGVYFRSKDLVVEVNGGAGIATIPNFNDVRDARKGECGSGSVEVPSLLNKVPKGLCWIRLRGDEIEIESAKEVDASVSTMSIHDAEVVHVSNLSLHHEVLFASVLQRNHVCIDVNGVIVKNISILKCDI